MFAIVAFLVVIVVVWRLQDEEWATRVFLAVSLGALVGVVTAFLTLILGIFVVMVPAVRTTEAVQVPLVAVKDNVGSSGSFFLGTGRVKSSLYYYYYKRLDSGAYKADRVAAYKAVIFEDEQRSPYLSYDKITGKGIVNWLLWVMPEYNDYQFHIPKGSVRSQFDMDLE